jgi:hypothetical protein
MAKENKFLKFINPLDPSKSLGRKAFESAALGHSILDLSMKALGLKDGGRVRKGCGVAKRGFGKAMKRKK